MNAIKRFFVALVSGLLGALPITGFIYGFVSCTDCGGGIAGFFGRIFIGFVHAFLNVITLGAPWDNESGTSFKIYDGIRYSLS